MNLPPHPYAVTISPNPVVHRNHAAGVTFTIVDGEGLAAGHDVVLYDAGGREGIRIPTRSLSGGVLVATIGRGAIRRNLLPGVWFARHADRGIGRVVILR